MRTFAGLEAALDLVEDVTGVYGLGAATEAAAGVGWLTAGLKGCGAAAGTGAAGGVLAVGFHGFTEGGGEGAILRAGFGSGGLRAASFLLNSLTSS